MKRSSLGRVVAAVTLLFAVLCVAGGCSLLDFGRHDSFDEWYSGPEDAFDPDSIGCTSLDGGFPGYVLNDMLLRTPAMLVHETTRTALVPFAASCFACRHVLGSDEPETASPARPPQVEEAPGASESAPEES